MLTLFHSAPQFDFTVMFMASSGGMYLPRPAGWSLSDSFSTFTSLLVVSPLDFLVDYFHFKYSIFYTGKNKVLRWYSLYSYFHIDLKMF